MAPQRKDTIRPTTQAQARMREEQAKRRAAEARKRAQDKVRGKKSDEDKRKEAAAEAARLEKEAKALRARAAVEAKKGSGFSSELIKGAAEAEAKAAAARKRARRGTPKPALSATPAAAGGPASARGVNVASADLVRRMGVGAVPPAAPRPSGTPAASGGVAARTGGTAGAPSGTSAPAAARTPPAAAITAKDVDEEFSKRFAHMQWAWSHPELGSVLREAAAKGYNQNELTGRLFQTEWFKVHGTADTVAQLRDHADEYLVTMTDDVARRWAMQLISKEVQPSAVAGWVKEQAKSRYPALAAAIDSGVTVKQYANAYVTDAAAMLELPPESIDLADPKWGRPLEGDVDPKTGQRVPMERYKWVTMLKSDPVYAPMYDRTMRARTEAAGFAAQIQQRFGRSA